MTGVIGIVVSLLILMYLAYRDVSVIVLAPLCALLAVVLDGHLPILASFTQIFMSSVGQFVRDFFPLFLLGALFGKLMEDSGAAAKIADVVVKFVGPERTVLAIVLSCGILTYGGVSLFVVVFAAFPLARSLFQQADIPRRLIPASIALGSFTFTMTALPGTVQIQNQIPMPFFRTTAFAAPGLGCIGGAIMLVLGMFWLSFQVARARQNNEGFSASGMALQQPKPEAEAAHQLPTALRAFLPVICAVGLNFGFSHFVIPHWETSYLADDLFGGTDISKLRGTWSTIMAMVTTLLITIALHHRTLPAIRTSVTAGAGASLLPVFNTASEYGYGNTIRALAGFTIVQNIVTGISPGNPLISEAVAVNALAAMTGSASGGLSIALKALGETYYERGLAAGINPELLHRIASMSCGGLDSLPHNGAVITLLLICGVTHREGYKDIAVVSVVGPLIATISVLALGTMFGSF